MTKFHDQLSVAEKSEKELKSICILGGITTAIVLAGILLDVVAGNITGGNLSALPQTAAERFMQLQNNPFLGLYNLDLLNMIIQLIFIPSYFALYWIHRNSNKAYALLALIIFLVGTVILVINNSALSMVELSNKYFVAADESQKTLLEAAGEAILTRGAHGTKGAFLGFFIPNLAGVLMSYVMLKGKLFSKTNALFGIIGSILMLVYVFLVTFVPEVKNMATAFAMPGGILLLIWMAMFMIKLFKLGTYKNLTISN